MNLVFFILHCTKLLIYFHLQNKKIKIATSQYIGNIQRFLYMCLIFFMELEPIAEKN